jgi:Icc-related predicted phosphoesterase
MAITFTAEIHKEITKLFERIEKKNPDLTSNTGNLIGRAHIWDQIQSYAKKQSDVAWEALEKEDIVNSKGLTSGEHTLAESPHFFIVANVTKPYKKFSPDVLAESLKKKYRVPLPVTKELIEQAKVDDKPRTSLKIVERG